MGLLKKKDEVPEELPPVPKPGEDDMKEVLGEETGEVNIELKLKTKNKLKRR